jgi:hypothetical protein
MHDKTAPGIATRESLVSGPPLRRAGERKAMRREYSETYRHRQRSGGIPGRREFAEACMQAALQLGYGENDGAAKEIIRHAGRILRSVQKSDGSRRYSQCGILHRANAVLAEIIGAAPVISDHEDWRSSGTGVMYFPEQKFLRDN